MALAPGLIGDDDRAPDPRAEARDRARQRDDDLEICARVREARQQADEVRKTRLEQNRVNQAAFMAKQDWSYKQPGQSREFLPRIPLATEQISNYVKRSLTDFGDWFQCELPDGALLSADDARAWLRQELELMHRVQQGRLDFATTIADAVKTGLLHSLAILKVHGRATTQRQWSVDPNPLAPPAPPVDLAATAFPPEPPVPFPAPGMPGPGPGPLMPPDEMAMPPIPGGGPLPGSLPAGLGGPPGVSGPVPGGPGPGLPPGAPGGLTSPAGGLPGGLPPEYQLMPPVPMGPGGPPVSMPVASAPKRPLPAPPPEDILRQRDVSQWHLVIDLIDPEDYYPDPSGAGMYEIQRAERDLSEIRKMAQPGPNGEAPIYDPDVVDELEASSAQQWDDERRRALRGESAPDDLKWRPRVTLDEYWGSITDEHGEVRHENIVCVVANDKWLIRPPEPNPFWHGQSPFVVAPLMRVPFSVWHKALFDAAVGLNLSMNELYSLMLDGGLASVWGTRTVRPGMLEDPRQITNGVPQGATLVIKDEAPGGMKVFEQVAQGTVPQEAMAMFQMASNEFLGATLLSDVQRGQMPPKDTTATATAQAVQASATFFDGVVRDLEDKLIEPVLWKGWCVLLQNADDVRAADVASAIGPDQAFRLARMTPAQRYATMAQGARFKVTGVSAVANKQQLFQKVNALLNTVNGSPLLQQAFYRTYSAEKVVTLMIRSLNIDPRTIELDDEEKQQQMIATMIAQQGLGGPGGGTGAPTGGAPPPDPSMGLSTSQVQPIPAP